VKYAEKPLFQSQTDKNTVLPAARKYTADRKQKASENAAEWTVRSLKMLINQGFSELKRSDSSIYIRYLKFSFLTVHTKIERRKTSELQTKNHGCGNAFIHTDEQNNVHCRRADTAGCQRNQRSEQNRQKLADALAWASDIAGTSRMGDENTAERCSLSQP